MSCFSPNIAILAYKEDGRRPNPNDYRSVALSVGPDVVNDFIFSTASPIPNDPISFLGLTFIVNENQNVINLICISKGNNTMALAYVIY